jgi:hypothetical protein
MLDSKDIEKSPIKELVSENYVFAAVLHYFGISFFSMSRIRFLMSAKNIKSTHGY